MSNAETSAIDVLCEAGLIPPLPLTVGSLVRCPTTDKPHSLDAAFIYHSDPPSTLWWMDWRTGQSGTWTEKSRKSFTPEEKEAFKRRNDEAKKARDEEEARRQNEAAEKANRIYNYAVPCISHPYLQTKGIKSVLGLKESVRPDRYPALIVPIFEEGGEIVSLQYIGLDGSKRFLSGGRKKGCFFPVGKDKDKPLVICEGVATGISIFESSGLPVLVAFDSGNLRHVASMARAKYPERKLLLFADNDIDEENPMNKSNVGIEAAREAALSVGGYLAIPELSTGGKTDANDQMIIDGPVAIQDTIQRAFDAGPITKAQKENEQVEPSTEEQPKVLPSSQSGTMNEEIARLAELPPLEYERIRKAKAKELGISRMSVLDEAVRALRVASESKESPFDEAIPWPETIDPATLLMDISQTIRRFIICGEEEAYATALWAAFTWFIDAVHVAPLLVITAPEKACGKSLLLSLIGKLAARPLPVSNISPAALYRSIERWKPTLLIDETDSFMKDNEELRGILNSGHTREQAFVIRTVGDDHTPTKFCTWGAKALAGIGHVADTIMSRAVIISLKRKLTDENIERIRQAPSAIFDDLRAKLARFAADYREQVRTARPLLPEGLSDREQDNWEPLFAIAMTAGDEWLNIATEVALKLSCGESETMPIGTELLRDIQEIFEEKDIERITTTDLIEALCADEEKRWLTYNRGGHPISPAQLSRKLSGYKIQSKNIRAGVDVRRGFERKQFEDAFQRYIYIPSSLSPVFASKPLQSFAGTDHSDFENATQNVKPLQSATVEGSNDGQIAAENATQNATESYRIATQPSQNVTETLQNATKNENTTLKSALSDDCSVIEGKITGKEGEHIFLSEGDLLEGTR